VLKKKDEETTDEVIRVRVVEKGKRGGHREGANVLSSHPEKAVPRLPSF